MIKEINIWYKSNMLSLLDIKKEKIKWKNIISYICRCDCWKVKTIKKNNFMKWQKSCWCYKVNLLKSKTIHWLSFDRKFIDAFYSAKKRTINNELYIKKWIKFNLWNVYKFKEEMYNSYLEHIEKYWKKILH